MIETVFLDVDGVLADFHSAACLHYQLDPQEHVGHHALHEGLGLNWHQFILELELENPSFWLNLDSLPWAKNLIRFLLNEISEDLVFLSSGGSSLYSAAQKEVWLHCLLTEMKFPRFPLIVTHRKYLLSHSTALLVDDHESQINAWKRRGGKALLFPSPSNCLHDQEPFEYFLSTFATYQHELA